MAVYKRFYSGIVLPGRYAPESNAKLKPERLLAVELATVHPCSFASFLSAASRALSYLAFFAMSERSGLSIILLISTRQR